jgi:hypothetical protein
MDLLLWSLKAKTMTANSYPNDRDFQPHDLKPRDQDSQYALTPGYYGRAPTSSCGLSPFPDYHHDNDRLSKTTSGRVEIEEAQYQTQKAK